MKTNMGISTFWSGTFLLSSLIFSAPAAGAKSQSLGGVVLTEVTPRIVTPNGDALNDKIFFKFDTSLTGIPIETNVFDVSGAKVSSLILDPNDIFLTWDGRDQSGNNVPSGIYIYSIKIGKNLATGTVVVAR